LGTVTSLKGSIIHAGPASETTRVILFFTTEFKEKFKENQKAKYDLAEPFPLFYCDSIQYNSYSQHTAITLFSDMIINVWNKKNITQEHKVYLEMYPLFSEGNVLSSYTPQYWNYFMKCINHTAVFEGKYDL
jgi:hypothetical protein